MSWDSTEEVTISKNEYSWEGDNYDTDWYDNALDDTTYIISTAAELAGLAFITNSNTGTYKDEQFEGKTIKLGADIALQDEDIEILQDDYSVNEDLTLKTWTPIGRRSNEFKGTFDGSGYTISGLYINSSSIGYYGLFGFADDATIKDITLEDSYIKCGASGTKPTIYAGVILGRGDNITISDCTVTARVILNVGNSTDNQDHAVGGVAGRVDTEISDCTFSGMVLGKSVYMGGIVGNVDGSTTISDCANYGIVANQFFKQPKWDIPFDPEINNSGSTGGILGYGGSGVLIQIKNCENQGQVTGLSGCIGGIAGYLYGEYDGASTVENCANRETVNHTTRTSVSVENIGYIGGIAGYTQSIFFRNCTNEGMVAAANNILSAGGITGSVSRHGKTEIYSIENCYNSGTVYVFQGTGAQCLPRCGGIAAMGSTFITIKNCVNTGLILTRSDSLTNVIYTYDNSGGTGGIAGFWNGNIEQCWNSGAVTGCRDVGGIVGRGTYSNYIIKNCYNTGAVSSTEETSGYAGGVMGCDTKGQKIENCYNAGEVSGANVGGVAGNMNSNKVSNCYYLDTSVTGGNKYGASKSAEDMTGEGWKDIFIGFDTAIWDKKENTVNALYLPHLIALENKAEPVEYSDDLDDPLSYPYLPANEVVVTLEDKTYDGSPISMSYEPKDGTSVPDGGVTIQYTGTTYAKDFSNQSYGPTDVAPTNAGTYTVTIQYAVEKDGETTYYLGKKNFEIKQATPSGTPTYTSVTEPGKTLGELGLICEFKDVSGNPMTGTLKWDNDNSTIVQPGQYYSWTFTPANNENGNYKDAKGSFAPWTVDVEGVSLSQSSLNLYVDEEEKLTVTFKPENATNQNVTWSSSNEDVAIVDENGNITAVGEGDAIITVTTEEGSYTASCTVTVKDKSSGSDDEGRKSGSGGSTVRYAIIVADSENGEIQCGRDTASRGKRVTFTVTPDEGYEISELTVTDSRGRDVAFSDRGDGTYTFVMPGSKVTISAVFTRTDCPRDKICPMYGFSDLNLYAWYHDGVHYCLENGLMVGTGADTFSPDDTTTRAQIVTILWRMTGSPIVNCRMDFEDVDPSAWYDGEAVRWAVGESIMTGYGNGNFGPNDPITREQFAVMLYNYAVWSGKDTVTLRENLNSFADSESVSPYAVQALNWTVDEGIISGKDDQLLDPKGQVTRAQATSMLQRFLEN